jgi:hypothetical protein
LKSGVARHRDQWFVVELGGWCLASVDVQSAKQTLNYKNHQKVVLMLLGDSGRNRSRFVEV